MKRTAALTFGIGALLAILALAAIGVNPGLANTSRSSSIWAHGGSLILRVLPNSWADGGTPPPPWPDSPVSLTVGV